MPATTSACRVPPIAVQHGSSPCRGLVSGSQRCSTGQFALGLSNGRQAVSVPPPDLVARSVVDGTQ